MTPLTVACAALTVAVAGLLVAEARASRAGIWLAKPAASTLFVVVAYLAGATGSTFGLLVLCGLGLSWFGDVFLIGQRTVAFIAGLSAFLLAHLAYAAAFFTLPIEILPTILAGAGMILVAIVVLRWLWPGLPAALRAPVVAYVLVIALMVAMAGGTVPARGPVLLLAAAVFAASDIFVARERFVRSSLANRLCGLPLYYAAQLAFALSVSG